MKNYDSEFIKFATAGDVLVTGLTLGVISYFFLSIVYLCKYRYFVQPNDR